jgi:hypothetical protein
MLRAIATLTEEKHKRKVAVFTVAFIAVSSLLLAQ